MLKSCDFAALSLQAVARRPRRYAKTHTGPQRARSDARNLRTGSCANREDAHWTIARAIRHARSPQRVARAWQESQPAPPPPPPRFCAPTTPEESQKTVSFCISTTLIPAEKRKCKIAIHISLSTFPVRPSMHFTLYLPVHASMRFTVYFLCAFLHASRCHFPCACLYAFHCLHSLCTHLCACLSTCPTHFTVRFPYGSSMHFTVYFPYAVELCRTQRLYRKNPSQCFREPWKNSVKPPRERARATASNHVVLRFMGATQRVAVFWPAVDALSAMEAHQDFVFFVPQLVANAG